MVRRAVRAVKWQAGAARNYPRWRMGVPGLEPLAFNRSKRLHKSLGARELFKPLSVLVNCLAKARQLLRRGHVQPARDQRLRLRCEGNVVAQPRRLPAARRNHCAEVRLVRRFVLREANVTVDPSDTVLGRYALQLVGSAEGINEDINKLLKGVARGLIGRAVLVEPGLVIMHAQILQEAEDRPQVERSLHRCPAFCLIDMDVKRAAEVSLYRQRAWV